MMCYYGWYGEREEERERERERERGERERERGRGRGRGGILYTNVISLYQEQHGTINTILLSSINKYKYKYKYKYELN